jgi:hypothetical protein
MNWIRGKKHSCHACCVVCTCTCHACCVVCTCTCHACCVVCTCTCLACCRFSIYVCVSVLHIYIYIWIISLACDTSLQVADTILHSCISRDLCLCHVISVCVTCYLFITLQMQLVPCRCHLWWFILSLVPCTWACWAQQFCLVLHCFITWSLFVSRDITP